MRFALASAWKDLRRLRRDTPTLLGWLLLPLVVAGLIGMTFGRQDIHPHGLLLIADQDEGLAAAFVRESVSRSDVGRMMALESADAAEGRERMNRGEASALLIIPKGFDDAVRQNQRAELELITNPEEPIMGRLAREVASATVDAAVWAQKTMQSTGALGGAMVGASHYLYPPTIAVRTTIVEPPGTPKTVGALLFPGTVFLVVLIVAQGMSMEIWQERGAGAVRRLLGARGRVYGLLAGKVAATSVLFLLAVVVVFAAGRFMYRVRMEAPVTAAVWATCSAVVFYLALLVAQLALASERTALMVAAAIVMPLSMLGGSFFPVEIMPETFARIAHAVPNGWMLAQFKLALNGHGMSKSFAVLAAAGAVAFAAAGLLAARKLRD
jgi:ABC-type Na+ efflux pump permease subunit